jgi:hypothetical protein
MDSRFVAKRLEPEVRGDHYYLKSHGAGCLDQFLNVSYSSARQAHQQCNHVRRRIRITSSDGKERFTADVLLTDRVRRLRCRDSASQKAGYYTVRKASLQR